MQKTYIFKTKDGKEKTLRGSAGLELMNRLEKDNKVGSINVGQIVTTINTKFDDQFRLEEFIG